MSKTAYTIFGSKHCSQCQIVKKLFTMSGIEYDYHDLESLPPDEAEVIKDDARAAGIASMPIVLDNNRNVVDWRSIKR